MKRFIFGVILSVLWTMCSWADGAAETVDYDFIEGEFAYRVTHNSTAYIVCFASEEARCSIEGNDLVIPSTVCHDGVEYPVDGLSFYWCGYTNAWSGEYVAAPYISVKNCHIPRTLKLVNGYAYYMKILAEAFVVEEGNSVLKSVDGVLLSSDGKTAERYPVLSEDVDWVIPDGVEELGISCFSDEDLAFIVGTHLLKLPATLRSMSSICKSWTFDVEIAADNQYLELIDKCVISKEDWSLNAVLGLAYMDHLVLPDCVKKLSAYGKAISSFGKTNDDMDATIILPEGLETIGDNGFRGIGCKEIHLPKSVQDIGEEIFMNSDVRCLEVPGNPKTVEKSFLNCCSLMGDIREVESSKEEWGISLYTALYTVVQHGLELVELGDEPSAFHAYAFFPRVYKLMTEHPLRHLVSHIEDPFAEWPTATPSELFTFDLRAPHWGILWVPEGTGARYAEAVVAGIWPKCERIREIRDGLIVMCEPVNSSFHFDEVVEDTGIRVSYEHTYAVGDVEFDRFDGFRSSDESVATIDEEGRLVLHGEGETLITAVSLDTEGREYAHEYRVSVGPNSETDIVEMPIQSTGAAYYTLQGQFAGTDPSVLSSGLYVRREAGVATKILIP